MAPLTFDDAFMRVEPQLREAIEEGESRGLYFRADGMPMAKDKMGFVRPYDVEKVTEELSDTAFDVCFQLMVVIQDLAEFMGLDGENLSWWAISNLHQKVMARYRGQDLPL